MHCPIALFAEFQKWSNKSPLNEVTNRHWIASHDEVSPRKAFEYVHSKCSVQYEVYTNIYYKSVCIHMRIFWNSRKELFFRIPRSSFTNYHREFHANLCHLILEFHGQIHGNFGKTKLFSSDTDFLQSSDTDYHGILYGVFSKCSQRDNFSKSSRKGPFLKLKCLWRYSVVTQFRSLWNHLQNLCCL